jgi:tRNA nucleotidyltransferase (CCA-adding enzyme)
MEILEKVLVKIKPDARELERMQEQIQAFVGKLEENIKKRKVGAEVFVGGSSGKGTVVKREKQDIDIFVRFDKKYDDEKISELLGKILTGFRKIRIRGSRDYFKVNYRGVGFEVVPVLKVEKPEDAKNITDLSFFHVSYVNKKLESKPKLKGGIILAKSFCYAQRCYGAESYIKGFSGYALELLVINYGSFLNLIKAIAKLKLSKEEKLIIDLERHYKNKQQVMLELNEAKLGSPIIFVDPTFKERNVLAGLSYETFLKFKEACKKFLKKPSEKFFFKQEINGKNYNLILKAETSKQEGDIAGSKLFKFFKLIARELEKYFEVKRKEFEYDDKKTASLYFKIKAGKKRVIEGPPITAVENVVKFKKKHKKVFVRKGKVYAREKSKSIKQFLADFKKDNREKMRDMGIAGFKLG